MLEMILVGVAAVAAFVFGALGFTKMNRRNARNETINEIRAEAAEQRAEDQKNVKRLKAGYEEMDNGRIRDAVTKRWVRKDDAFE